MSVELTNEQDALSIDEAKLNGEIEALARAVGYGGDLSVALVSDEAIHRLNRDFLGHDYPTDVLAFPLGEEQGPEEGEIVVSAERAIAEAKDRGVSSRAELFLYITHGILHLAGYDDHEPEEARKMHAVALRLLRGFGYRNRVASRQRGEAPISGGDRG